MPPTVPSNIWFPGEYFVIIDEREADFGDYTPGRYVWILANVRPIEPVPAKGMQRLWEWEGHPI